MHWNGNYFMGHGFGGIFMILFWVVLVVIVVSLLRREGLGETAEEVAKKRYARGEISREEFERIRHDLKG